ncbi:MAG: porin [Colwellia sp.]|nr:porin [Colwellia sp.]
MIKRISLSLLSLAFVANAYGSSVPPQVNFGASGIFIGTYNDSDAQPYKINAGYSLNQNFSVELNYFDFGEDNSRYDGSGIFFADGYSFEFLAKYPISDFSIYAKLGVLWWTEEGERVHWWEEGAAIEHLKSDGNDIIYGVGVSYSITENVSLKIEFQQSDINNTTTNPLSLGFDVQF